MRSRPSRPSSRWPFWLLAVAWMCANSPQVAVYAVLTWLAEARTFAHQEELSRSVAHLLAGERAEGRVARSLARVREAQERDERRPAPAVPAAAVVKKMDLAAEETIRVEPAAATTGRFGRDVARTAVSRRAEPAHGPPRGTAA